MHDYRNLKINDVQLFDIEPDEARIKVAGCSVCHTDIGYWKGETQLVKPPIILGHEISGVVEEVGEDVVLLNKGDHVILPPVYGDRVCKSCRRGDDNLCENYTMFGFNRPGGFAEEVTVPAKYAFRISDKLERDLEYYAPVADALSTPFQALKVAIPEAAQIREGDWVAVYGCGGVGSGAITIANALGANVIAIDKRDSALEMAKILGAKETFNPNSLDTKRYSSVPDYVRKTVGGDGVGIAMECIGMPSTVEDAVKSLRKGGRAIDIGYIPDKIVEGKTERTLVKLWGAPIMFKGIGLDGTFGCRTSLFPELIRLVEEKNIPVHELVSEVYSLSLLADEETNEVFEEIEKGKYAGRVVITP